MLPHLMESLMQERERQYALRNLHPRERPLEPGPQHRVRRAMAAAATLRPKQLLHERTTWKPMTHDEAEGVLSQEPPAIGTVKGQSGRYVEAWMVQWGAPPARIKTVLERLRGYPV
jgi:hypothetical protein